MKKFLLFALLSTAAFAHASDWQSIASRGTSFYYMDFDSLTNSGPYKKAWIKGDFYEAQQTDNVEKKEFHSTKSLYYFDCVGKRLVSIQYIAYEKLGGAGEIVESLNSRFDPKILNDVVPDTMGERFLNIACSSLAVRMKLKKENAAGEAAAAKEIRDFQKKLQADLDEKNSKS